jgi:translation initiation factor IF-2
MADAKGVQLRRYDIIYKVTDELRESLEGMLTPEKREIELGRALVQRAFSISRVGTVAGCRVLGGTIERNSRVRVIRDSRIIGDYALDSLKREKDDAREVREGLECGIKLAGFNDVKEGDVLESFKIEEVARTL